MSSLEFLSTARVIDLTHVLHAGVPFWPGRGYRPFSYRAINDLRRDGVSAGEFRMPEHLGTHVDAPSHFVASPTSIDRLPIENLVCAGVVVDIAHRAKEEPGALLDVADLERWHGRHGEFPARCAVLIRSNWASRWTDASAFANTGSNGKMRFPAVSEAAARVLAGDPAVVGIGLDTLSADNGFAEGSPCHHLLHGADKFIVENLANLEQLPARDFLVFFGPLPIRGGSGAPARVLALVSPQ